MGLKNEKVQWFKHLIHTNSVRHKLFGPEGVKTTFPILSTVYRLQLDGVICRTCHGRGMMQSEGNDCPDCQTRGVPPIPWGELE